MYSCYCKRCGCGFQSSNYNSNYCSHVCADNERFELEEKAKMANNGQQRSSALSGTHDGGGGIPFELILVIAVGVTAWDSMKKWEQFEPVTRHILHLFYYIFYKPLHFSTNIHAYLTKLEVKFGGWMFFVKWGTVIFYVLFIFALYLVVIEMLNQKRLNWVWILFLLSPLITHGIWYFFIA